MGKEEYSFEISFGCVIIVCAIMFTNSNSLYATSLSSFKSICPGCTDSFPITLTTSNACCICTGNPFFTTDTASALRAVEIGAEIILKGTRVDGVYSADPEKDPKATRYNKISFNEVIKKELNVMDLTAFTMCKENNLPIYVFDMNKKGNLLKVVNGEDIGTLVSN